MPFIVSFVFSYADATLLSDSATTAAVLRLQLSFSLSSSMSKPLGRPVQYNIHCHRLIATAADCFCLTLIYCKVWNDSFLFLSVLFMPKPLGRHAQYNTHSHTSSHMATVADCFFLTLIYCKAWNESFDYFGWSSKPTTP